MSAENAVCMGCLVNQNWWRENYEIPSLIVIDTRPPGSPNYTEITSQKPFEDLTLQEKEILRSLASAWNSFSEIEKKDSSLKEFNDAIHRCQQLIALRVARRVNPEVWVQE